MSNLSPGYLPCEIKQNENCWITGLPLQVYYLLNRHHQIGIYAKAELRKL